jgi:hypothetical protein
MIFFKPNGLWSTYKDIREKDEELVELRGSKVSLEKELGISFDVLSCNIL